MPGGWHFEQVLSTGQKVKITAFSFEELISNMLSFRLRHLDLCGAEHATKESAVADLKAYICAHYKQNCADSNGSRPVVTEGIGIRADYTRPIDRAGAWIAELGNTRTEKVDYGLAGVRAQTCVQCPQNIRWQSGCAPCNDNILVRVQNFKGGLRTPLDQRLHMCRVFGFINEVAIWLTDQHATADQELPSNCWKYHESTPSQQP